MSLYFLLVTTITLIIVIFRGVAMSSSHMALPAMSCFKADSTQITWQIQTQMNSLDPDLKYFQNFYPNSSQTKMLQDQNYFKNTSGLPRYVS